MAETIEKDNNDDHVDYSSVIEDFSNDGYVIIENFFTHNDIVNSTKNKEQVNLIEILKRESLDLFNKKKEENDRINGVDDSTISSCILEPMNGQYINNYNLNNEIKLNKYKYKKNCPLSVKGATKIDYKNIKLLKRYVSENGKILPSRITNISQKKQRELSLSIKRARNLALL